MKMTNATRITIFRIVTIPAFIICALNTDQDEGFRIAALALFVIMGASDAVDGYLARHYNQQTRLGTVLDPVADKMLMTSAFIMVAVMPGAWGWADQARTIGALVVLIVSRDVYIVLGFVILYLVKGHADPAPNWLGKVTTTAHFLTVCALFGGVYYGNNLYVLWPLYAATLGATVASGFYYTWLGLKQLTSEDPDEEPS